MQYLKLSLAILITILLFGCQESTDAVATNSNPPVSAYSNIDDRNPADYSDTSIKSAGRVDESSLKVLGRGPVIPINKAFIPISTVNVKEVELELFYAKDPGLLISEYKDYIHTGLDNYAMRNPGRNRQLQSVFTQRYQIPQKAMNQQVQTRLALPENIREGWYIAAIRKVGDVDFSFFPINVTSLSIRVVKNTAANRGTVLINHFDTGLPVLEGSIRRYKNTEVIESTFSDGKIVVTDINNTTIVITAGERVGILHPSEVPLDLSGINNLAATRLNKAFNAYIWSNRDLVKPGEELPIRVLLRDNDGKRLPQQPITIALRSPDHKTVLTKDLKDKGKGYYEYDLTMPTSAQLGTWTVQVRTNKTRKTALSEFKFQVQTFKPERMDLEGKVAAQIITSGKNNTLDLTGRYLFGTPASDNKVTLALQTRVLDYLPGQYSAYVIGEKVNLSRSQRYQGLSAITLDNNGQATTPINGAMHRDINAVLAHTIRADLMEDAVIGAQRNYRFISVPDNTALIGVKPSERKPRYDSSVSFDIALIASTEKKLLKGDVKLSLYKRSSDYYWVFDKTTGWDRVYNKKPWNLVATEHVTTTNGGTSAASFKVKWGRYKLVAESTLSGNTVYEFYAGWHGNHSLGKIKPEQLDTRLDAQSYQDGQPITLTVVAPKTGQFDVSLVADDVVWSKTMPLQQGQSVDITLPNHWPRHDLYVVSTLLTTSDNGYPKRYLDVKPIKLNRESRQLVISDTLPTKIEPKKVLTLPLSIPGAPAGTQVIVSLVDKGIINITRFEQASPYDFFFEQRAMSFSLVDYFGRFFFASDSAFAKRKFGGDMAGEANRVSDTLLEDKTIALMTRSVTLDDQGKATLAIDIPDYNGEARLRVTAFNDDQFGAFSKDITINSPVVVELSTPRFVTPGDQSMLFGTVHNMTGEDQDFTVSIAIPESMSTQSPLQLTAHIKQGQRYTFKLPIVISPQSHSRYAPVTLTAKTHSGLFAIERQWQVPIRAALPIKKSLVDYHILNPGQTAEYGNITMDNITSPQASLFVSSMPFFDTQFIAKNLMAYPYGCAEQTTSKANLWLLDDPALAAKKQNIIQAKGQSEKQIISQAVIRLQKFKRYTGGYSLWEGGSHDDPYLTAYVVDFLIKARQKYGVDIVPKSMTTKSLSWLKAYIFSDRSGPKYTQAASYAAYLLSKAGRITYSELRQLMNDTAENTTPLATAYLASALNTIGVNSDTVKATIQKSFSLARSEDTYYGDYGSKLRDYAVIIKLINQMQLSGVDGLGKLKLQYLAALSDGVRARRYLSTQEQISILGAVTDSTPKNPIEIVLKNGHDLSSITTTSNIAQLVALDSQVKNNGQQAIYATLRVQGYAKQRKDEQYGMAKVSHRRSYLNLQGDVINPQQVTVGEQIIVVNELILKDKDINNAMVVDLIPSGFVLENPDLGQAADLSGMSYVNLNSETVTLTNDFDLVEYRQDRFVASGDLKGRNRYSSQPSSYVYAYVLRAEIPGLYQLPPSYIENMYKPENHSIFYPSNSHIQVTSDE